MDPKPDKGAKHRKDTIASKCGFEADEIADYRSRIEGVRERKKKIAEATRRDALAQSSKVYEDEVSDLRLRMLDPKEIDKVVPDPSGFRTRLERDASLDKATRAALMQDYHAVCSYVDKYHADKDAHRLAEEKLKKAQADHDRKAAEAAQDELRQRGYFDKDGVFQPASAFIDTKDVSMQTYEDFSDEQPFWNGDKRQARARLEAAKMTGRLSHTFYENRLAFLRAKSKEGFEQRWKQIYPLVRELEQAGYGKQKLTKAEKKYRADHGVPAAIWAKKSQSKANGTAATFLADSLAYDDPGNGRTYEDSTEEFVDLETMRRVYDTCADLEASGVELKEAVRQIIAPSLSKAFGKNIIERLDDQDFLDAIRRNYDEEHGWSDDLGRAVTGELVKQGRVKAEKKETSDKNGEH